MIKVEKDISFFEQNRIELLKAVGEDTVLVFYAGGQDKISADNEYIFLPDRNFYYLTGVEDHDTAVIMSLKDGEPEVRLYVPEKDSLKERWHGKRKTHEEYSKISGISEEFILDYEKFDEDVFKVISDRTKLIGYDSSSVKSCVRDFVELALKTRTSEELTDVKDILTKMRMVKKPFEIEAIKVAAKLTEDAIEDLKSFIKPGMTELELHTKLDYEMARRGCRIPAFNTIVAVGENVFYLHHSDPDETVVKEGDHIQIDVGGRCLGYCADISRVLFIGKSDDEVLEERKAKLHELIRKLRKEAFSFIKPGVTFAELNTHVKGYCLKWLQNEGLIQLSSSGEGNDDNIVADYYWHNTSHHMGLDVHDISVREEPFKEGNCLAVEPGVYIKEWGIGFRIEDDVLVTKDGCELLSSGKDDMEVL